MDISFNIRAKGNQYYIYLNCNADDGRVRKSLGKVQKEQYPDNIPKPLKNLMDRVRMRIDNHAGNVRLSGSPILKADIDSIVESEKRGKIKPVTGSITFGVLVADFYHSLSVFLACF